MAETAPRIEPVSPADEPAVMAGSMRLKRRVGIYSREGALAAIDGRSREAAYLKRLKAELVAHLGGQVTAPQALAIKRLCMTALRLEQFDAKIIEGGTLTEHDARVYGALHNSFRLLLRELGVKSAAPKDPSWLVKAADAAVEAPR